MSILMFQQKNGKDGMFSMKNKRQSKSRIYVFGYGSLVHIDHQDMYRINKTDEYIYCNLNGYGRNWDACINTTEDQFLLNNYVTKTGETYRGYISYLNIYESDKHSITGALFEVSEDMLKKIDERELVYDRVDVTSKIDHKVDGIVWTYVVKEEFSGRYGKGVATGSIVIPKYYIDIIIEAFSYNQDISLTEFWLSTDSISIPIIDISKVPF